MTFGRAVTEGMDPADGLLWLPMPRWDLTTPQVEALAAFLKTSSGEPTPRQAGDRETRLAKPINESSIVCYCVPSSITAYHGVMSPPVGCPACITECHFAGKT